MCISVRHVDVTCISKHLDQHVLRYDKPMTAMNDLTTGLNHDNQFRKEYKKSLSLCVVCVCVMYKSYLNNST